MLDVAKLVLSYGDPLAEAAACRNGCALFDFSFVARARVRGGGALARISALTRRPLDRLGIGRIAYAVHTDAHGRAISDLTIWRHATDDFEVMSGSPPDIALLQASRGRGKDAGCDVSDLSAQTAILAVQGPGALAAFAGLTDTRAVAALPYFSHTNVAVAGVPCVIGRLGYTGEAGFEIIAPATAMRTLWRTLSGRARPSGFIAADTLRIEAGFVLFANEFALPVTPREAGLGTFAGGEKNDDAATGPPLALVAFKTSAAAPSGLYRPAAALRRPQVPGTIAVTSLCRSVAGGCTLGLGYVPAADVAAGRARFADTDGELGEVHRVSRPFYDVGKRRPRRTWDYRPE